MPTLLKSGAKGELVSALQTKLAKLGFSVNPDGQYGPATKQAVEDVQSLFGYDVDGIVGDATEKLIDAQAGYGWNAAAPDAVKRGLEAQGKKDASGSLAGAALARTLKKGTDGPDVRYLQRRLTALGFAVALDGKYGPATEDAVRKLQKAHGYDVDGVVGDATNKLLNQQIGLGWSATTAGS
jgi:peptidoglycan hydrolase-like protein with peptidoglycan-binding domain